MLKMIRLLLLFFPKEAAPIHTEECFGVTPIIENNCKTSSSRPINSFSQYSEMIVFSQKGNFNLVYLPIG